MHLIHSSEIRAGRGRLFSFIQGKTEMLGHCSSPSQSEISSIKKRIESLYIEDSSQLLALSHELSPVYMVDVPSTRNVDSEV